MELTYGQIDMLYYTLMELIEQENEKQEEAARKAQVRNG